MCQNVWDATKEVLIGETAAWIPGLEKQEDLKLMTSVSILRGIKSNSNMNSKGVEERKWKRSEWKSVRTKTQQQIKRQQRNQQPQEGTLNREINLYSH